MSSECGLRAMNRLDGANPIGGGAAVFSWSAGSAACGRANTKGPGWEWSGDYSGFFFPHFSKYQKMIYSPVTH